MTPRQPRRPAFTVIRTILRFELSSRGFVRNPTETRLTLNYSYKIIEITAALLFRCYLTRSHRTNSYMRMKTIYTLLHKTNSLFLFEIGKGRGSIFRMNSDRGLINKSGCRGTNIKNDIQDVIARLCFSSKLLTDLTFPLARESILKNVNLE